MSEGYNYDIHIVKSGVALSTISGRLTVHDATDHQTAESYRVDGSVGPIEPQQRLPLW
jgi:hypothetical protein